MREEQIAFMACLLYPTTNAMTTHQSRAREAVHIARVILDEALATEPKANEEEGKG